jgi:hypothetical protein
MNKNELLKQEAKKIYDWFIAVKKEAYIGNGLYRIKMREKEYNDLITIFEAISNGLLILKDK